MHCIPDSMKDKYHRPTSGLNYLAWDPHNFLGWNILDDSILDARKDLTLGTETV